MKQITTTILSLLILISGSMASATEENDEIQYLLTFVSSSGCIFIRNGDEHSATDAAEHLEMKYNYRKKRIHSAEDFIDKVASKSSLSRKQYSIRCNGSTQPSGQWLLEVLKNHRAPTASQNSADMTL